jgi:hypothetical protein
MARIPDAFIDDRAARTLACDVIQRAAARYGTVVGTGL